MAENSSFEDREDYPYERIVSALLAGEEPSAEDKKTLTEEELSQLRTEIEGARKAGLVVEIPF